MKHPVQRLSLSSNGLLYAAASNRIQSFSTSSGELVHEFGLVPATNPAELEEQPKKKQKINALSKSTIRTLNSSRDGKYVVVSTDEDKSVVVFDSDLQHLSTRFFPKRPSALKISDENNNIVLGDKFGDVYSVPLQAPKEAAKLSTGNSDSENGSDLEPILGHVSMLVDLEIVKNSNGSQFIITSDRDEHVRVTRYPESYIIERFCFGHEQYVSQLLVPEWDESTLISGGGDDFLLRWDWTNGEIIEKIDIKSFLYPDLNDNVKSEIEIAISGLWQVPKSQIILAYDEKAKKLLVLKLGDKTKLLASINKDILDLATISSRNDIWISSQDDSEVQISSYNVNEHGELLETNKDAAAKISQAVSFEIQSEGDIDGIHPINLLRKHAEH
ncbi:WD40-repeat-containing domain protein [Lipomyces japonicus]|uniref:WD40-repeat-containing domain protein n=1 Tax=Lipomyces japonicus TaxID=56871 RepID=UPI0034CE5098